MLSMVLCTYNIPVRRIRLGRAKNKAKKQPTLEQRFAALLLLPGLTHFKYYSQEQEQLKAIREQSQTKALSASTDSEAARQDKPYEAGFGGQEDLEDRYATTSGEH